MVKANKIYFIRIFFMLLVGYLLVGAIAANAVDNAYKPRTEFLKNEPYKKSKARVELTGVRNDYDLKIIENSINDILRFVRLFGLTNKNIDGSVILENTRAHPAFQMLTTEQGRRELDIDPASSRIEQRVYNWNVESEHKLSVDVLFKHQPLWRGPTETPAEKVYRFTFVKNQCDATWCLNESKRID